MKSNLILGWVVLLLIFCSAGAAPAVVVDFEDLVVSPGTQLNPPDNTIITSGGFNFVNGPQYDAIPDMHFPNNSGNSIGTTTELLTHGDLLMSGGTFSLFSFDLGSSFVEFPTFDVIGSKSGGGTVTQSFALDGNEATFETFFLNTDFTNLVEVNWLHLQTGSGSQSLFNIDNISVAPAVVPEPSTFLLLGGGLAGLAFAVRRRRKE